MPTALEVELKNYAHNLVADHVKYEYDRQIGFWQQYINLMVDAQAEALKRHQSVLDESRKQIEKEREAAFGLAMLALSAISGPVLAWVAAKIEHAWFPKFTSETRERTVFIAEQDSMWGKFHHVLGKDHDQAAAQIFGDLGKEAGEGTSGALATARCAWAPFLGG